MSASARFVGRSGEKRFSALCSDEGVTCNPAAEDDHGWDHVVEFPAKILAGIPADLQRSLPPIFVQSKAYKSDHRRIRMKLSNALALARSPNPCFVVVPPEKGTEHQSWRAVHFWKDMIAQTLKRARQATSQGIPENSLHKRWITFRLADTDRRGDYDLLLWIESTVRGIGHDYAAIKTGLLNSVGYEPDRFVGTIEFAMRSIEDLIDHQIGLTETIPVGKFELRDRRFGVEINVPIPTGGEMLGTLHAHPKECLLRLRGPDNTEIELKCNLTVGSLPGLPVEQCKFRVKGDFVDFIMRLSGGSKFELNYNTADKLSPKQLEKLVHMLSWAGKGPIDVQVSIDDKRLFSGHADFDQRSDQPGYRRLALLVSTLASLSSHLQTLVPSVSIEDVAAAEDQLVYLRGFLASPDMNVTARIETEAPLPEVQQVITYGFADVGTWRFGALTRWRAAKQSASEELWNLNLTDRQIIGRYAFEITDQAAFADFDADFGRHAAMENVLSIDDNAVARLVGSAVSPRR